MHEGVNLLTS